MRRGMIALALFCALVSGCASYTKKFQDKKVTNIGYFADSTVTVMGNLDLTVTREDTLLVRRFIDPQAPEVREVARWNANLRVDLSDMVGYSLELLNIAEEEMAEEERVKRYADHIEGYRIRLDRSEKIDGVLFDSTLERIRAQETLIEAVRTAQPILNAASIEAAIKIDHLTAAIHQLADRIDTLIDEEYAEFIRYRGVLLREKAGILAALETVHDAYRTEEPDLGRLKERGVIWNPEYIPDGPPTLEELEVLREHLEERLDLLAADDRKIGADWDEYLALHKELDRFANEAVHRAHQARVILLTWIRAHHKMASGVVDPADWFDASDLALELIRNSPKALP